MKDCIFCKIVRNEVPSNKVFENDDYIAFLDVRPLNPGHTLVIPKTHHRWVWDIPHPGPHFEVVARIAKALQKTMKTEWVSSDIAGMGVYHAHTHLIPRFPGDGHGEFPNSANAKDIPPAKMRTIAESIKKTLAE
ncbi:MAG TPA: HIT family protein [Candidatus Binatus sp.]|nr:HIT family protein [Candidatus Binatus sp.]